MANFMLTGDDVDRLFEDWRAKAIQIARCPKGSRKRNAAVIAADQAWRRYEEADDEVNGKPQGWTRVERL